MPCAANRNLDTANHDTRRMVPHKMTSCWRSRNACLVGRAWRLSAYCARCRKRRLIWATRKKRRDGTWLADRVSATPHVGLAPSAKVVSQHDQCQHELCEHTVRRRGRCAAPQRPSRGLLCVGLVYALRVDPPRVARVRGPSGAVAGAWHKRYCRKRGLRCFRGEQGCRRSLGSPVIRSVVACVPGAWPCVGTQTCSASLARIGTDLTWRWSRHVTWADIETRTMRRSSRRMCAALPHERNLMPAVLAAGVQRLHDSSCFTRC